MPEYKPMFNRLQSVISFLGTLHCLVRLTWVKWAQRKMHLGDSVLAFNIPSFLWFLSTYPFMCHVLQM